MKRDFAIDEIFRNKFWFTSELYSYLFKIHAALWSDQFTTHFVIVLFSIQKNTNLFDSIQFQPKPNSDPTGFSGCDWSKVKLAPTDISQGVMLSGRNAKHYRLVFALQNKQLYFYSKVLRYYYIFLFELKILFRLINQIFYSKTPIVQITFFFSTAAASTANSKESAELNLT